MSQGVTLDGGVGGGGGLKLQYLPGLWRCRAGISPMITSMKSTQESVPFKHSVVRLYI